ncbi:MAG TPA: hypothetical protein PLY41_09705 [Acetomicrobium sp.]|nr:hypothetical protein [Acetomicrobium sp.]
MKQRCEDESVPHYSRYGAKGIKVCPEWHSFDTFYKDMGERPKDMTLDRIDSKGGYNKANCQWSTPKQQARNVDRGCWIEGFGQKLRLVEWSERTGIASSTLRKRLTSGWNAEDILTKKVRKYAVSKR